MSSRQSLCSDLAGQHFILKLTLPLQTSLLNLSVDLLSIQQSPDKRFLSIIALTLVSLLVESVEQHCCSQQADQLYGLI
jgi:hypothetical protein